MLSSLKGFNKALLGYSVLLTIINNILSDSVTLNNIIQKTFPEEYAERKSEHDSLINFGNDLIPLFVMDLVIPCQKFPLHIFEPRYRLMVSFIHSLILIMLYIRIKCRKMGRS